MNYVEVKDVSGFLVDDSTLKLKIEAEHEMATCIRINANTGNIKDILSNDLESLYPIMATEDRYEGKRCMFIYYDGVAVIRNGNDIMKTFCFNEDMKNKFRRLMTIVLLRLYCL